MSIDLHTHSTASDGTLPPHELLARAQAAGVAMLAITDHDSVAAHLELQDHSCDDLRLITGTELSCYWNKTAVHVIGLNFDLHHPVMSAALGRQQQAREQRAEIIAQRLERAGIPDTLAGARNIASDAAIGRMHFAEYLVQAGTVRDHKTAFRKYLGAGKAGDVKSAWASMPEAIEWIRQAGGVAVLAHPAKYKLTNLKLEQLVADFCKAGGGAIEVVSGLQEATLTRRLGALAARHNLHASTGSDFHRPGQHWAALGSQPALPENPQPVWELW